jgi:hypothetical protein
MSDKWIAGKRQRIKRDGEYVWVDPGDPVPEAEHWPNRNAWERQGYIRRIKGHAASVESVEVTHKKAPNMEITQGAMGTPPESKDGPSLAAEPSDGGQGTDPEERPEETPPEASEEKPLSGAGACPYCEKDFLMLERHKCKKAPTASDEG